MPDQIRHDDKQARYDELSSNILLFIIYENLRNLLNLRPINSVQISWLAFYLQPASQAPKDDMHTAIRELEKMPRPRTMMPLSEMAALKSIGASIGDSVSGSSKYISLTTRR